MTKKTTIAEAKAYYAEIRKYKGGLAGFSEFAKEQREEYEKERKIKMPGMSPGSISNGFKLLKEENNLEGKHLLFFEAFNFFAERYQNHYKAFVDKNPLSDIDVKARRSLFKNTCWHLYFFHVPRPGRNRAALGRLILKIYEDGAIELKNIKDLADSRDYFGHIHEVKFLGDRFMAMPLNHQDTFDISFSNILINYSVFEGEISELMIGDYSNISDRNIETGTVVLQKIPFEAAETSKALTYLNGAEFEEIPIGIRQFLSLKKSNFIRLPNEIHTSIALEQFLDTYNINKDRQYHNDFFNVKKPIVFVASPSASSENCKIIDGLVHGIKKEENRLEYEYFGDNLKKHKRARGKIVSEEIKEMLNKTTLFVLFYFGDSGKPFFSNALMELGYALSYSKKILIFTNIRDFFKEFHFLNVFEDNLIKVEERLDLDNKQDQEFMKNTILRELTKMKNRGVL